MGFLRSFFTPERPVDIADSLYFTALNITLFGIILGWFGSVAVLIIVSLAVIGGLTLYAALTYFSVAFDCKILGLRPTFILKFFAAISGGKIDFLYVYEVIAVKLSIFMAIATAVFGCYLIYTFPSGMVYWVGNLLIISQELILLLVIAQISDNQKLKLILT